MPNSSPTLAQQARHLERVRTLSQEIHLAISAIEHNDLPKFRAAVGNQEQLCSELAGMHWAPASLRSRKPTVEAQPPATALSQQIHEAYRELAQLNRVYAGVVKRSKRANELLCILYGIQGEDYGKRPSPAPNVRTLSCEV